MAGKKKRFVPEMAMRHEELEALAQDRFAFLVREKGFTGPVDEQELQWTNHYYTNPPAGIGVEVSLDYRDTAVWVYLLRLRDGELPPHGFVDVARGERIRISVLQLLKNVLHVEDALLDDLYSLVYAAPPPGEWRGYQWADDALACWHEVVARHVDLVLQQPVERLFPPPPPGASPASQA